MGRWEVQMRVVGSADGMVGSTGGVVGSANGVVGSTDGVVWEVHMGVVGSAEQLLSRIWPQLCVLRPPCVCPLSPTHFSAH